MQHNILFRNIIYFDLNTKNKELRTIFNEYTVQKVAQAGASIYHLNCDDKI